MGLPVGSISTICPAFGGAVHKASTVLFMLRLFSGPQSSGLEDSHVWCV